MSRVRCRGRTSRRRFLAVLVPVEAGTITAGTIEAGTITAGPIVADGLRLGHGDGAGGCRRAADGPRR